MGCCISDCQGEAVVKCTSSDDDVYTVCEYHSTMFGRPAMVVGFPVGQRDVVTIGPDKKFRHKTKTKAVRE